MSSSRVVAALLALLAVIAAGPASASAGTVTKTVPGELVFLHGQAPGDPGNCSAIVFVKWSDVPGTTAATAHYESLLNAAWGERSVPREAPFDDTYSWVATYTVPAGSHWIQVGKGWRDGPGVDDCADLSANQPSGYRGTPTVELTIEEPAACVAARRKVTKATAAVATAQKQLRAASRRRKAAYRQKLARAKHDLKVAQANVKKRCPA